MRLLSECITVGKIVNNSTLHLGAYPNDKLEGVMSFGSPLDKRKVLPLVEGQVEWYARVKSHILVIDCKKIAKAVVIVVFV